MNKLLLIILLNISLGFAQDSTFFGYAENIVVDSVLFDGNTDKYKVDSKYHIALTTHWIDNHSWVIRDGERICQACLLWQKFHVEEEAVYIYDKFFKAKKKALELKNKNK